MGKEDVPPIKRQSYFRLLKYVRRYKARLAVGICCGMLTGMSLGGSFFWMKDFIKPFEKPPLAEKTVAENAATVSAPTLARPGAKEKEKEKRKSSDFDAIVRAAEWLGIPSRDNVGHMTLAFMFFFSISFVALWFVKNLATYINRYQMRWVGTRVVADLRDEVFKKLLNQSLIFYGKADVGQLISRCTNDTASIESAVANCIADATRCPFEILGCFGFIIYSCYHQKMFVLPFIVIVSALVIVLPLVYLGRVIRRYYRHAYQRIAEVVSRMHEVFTGIMTVKAYHMEQRELDYFIELNRKYFKILIRSLRPELMMKPLMEFVGVVAIIGFVAYSYANNLLLSDVAVLIVPAILAYQPIKDLAKVSTYIQRSMAAADRYFELIDTDTSIKEAPNPLRLREFTREIRFDNATFSYEPGGHMVLKGIDFTLAKGRMVAVVGETGSGKTTIANLIARFYDLTGGTVTIDGHDVRDLKISDLRDLVGIVTQDPILFNTTIAANIAYGCPNATEEEIVNAAVRANAHQFITDGRHPDHYFTVVGEKGCKLSGGEKQRVAIARAILKNPPILILDEATSALDTVTEKLVQDALDKLMENRTVFAIAHRLSTIKHADTILVLDKGKIIESGTHDELMAMDDGRYRRLCDIQFGKQMEKEV